MSKDIKIGDFVKWNGEKYWQKDNKRIDVVLDIRPASFGGIEILTKEINGKKGETPHMGKGYPEYFTIVNK